ncbi:hypothetical protein [Streptomyces sp. NPDC002537]
MANFIVNGDAEAGGPGSTDGSATGTVPGWENTGHPMPAVVQYGAVDTLGLPFPTATSPGPDPRGANFFAGGPGTLISAMQQTIYLDGQQDLIRTGATYDFTAWVGGYADQNDYAAITLGFRGTQNGQVMWENRLLPLVLAEDRDNTTGLRRRSVSGPVPSWTSYAVVGVQFIRQDGVYDDAYVDEVALDIH